MKNIYLRKTTALLTAVSLLFQSLYPIKGLASVSGPAQPEFSNFQSVNSNDLVNNFTGDFSYNIPVLEIPGSNGGGYAMSLSYHSGAGVEEEASWVGSGWTLNPGAIMRSKNGFPDDINAGSVTYYRKTEPTWTVAAGTNGSIGIRAFGVGASLGLTSTMQYNNYKGLSTTQVPYIGYQTGWSSLSGIKELQNTTITFEKDSEREIQPRFSYSYVSPMSLIVTALSSAFSYVSKSSMGDQYHLNYVPGASTFHSQIETQLSGQSSSSYGAYSLYNRSISTPTAEYDAYSIRLSLGGYYAPSPFPIGFGASIFGTFNYQTVTKDEDDQTFYGYLYSHKATSSSAVMDYSIERMDDFNKHDEILPTPFASPDNFNVVCEGISGVMRAYSANVGKFRPKRVENTANPLDVGVHINAGLNISASISTNSGSSVLEVDAWADGGDNDKYEFTDTDQEYFFRFIGDMGGHVSQASSDKAESANLDKHGSNDYHAVLTSSSLETEINGGDVVGRSSYIAYNTNDAISYSNRTDIETLIGSRSETDQIGEFAITNKQGNRYIFALPVYAKDEVSASVSVTEQTTPTYLVYGSTTTAEVTTKTGQELNGKYAASYLITEITTPNYIDRTNDGPSDDDYGGWTKFNYTKCHTDYHWRMPWKGLIYDPKQLSDPDDDMGSFSSGNKEVYYLESIETNSYIAKFTLKDRKDGLEAEKDETADRTESGLTLTDNKKLKYLESITLYAKDENGNAGEVMKRVYFEYDYSTWPGQPNTNGTGSETGKLTLKKLWFEYGDVRNANIAPYEFNYTYPTTDYPSAYEYEYDYTDIDSPALTSKTDLYAQFENYGDGLTENPSYDAANIDRWGNYRANGKTRIEDMENWVDQDPDKSFDPAAWQLKQIKLPGGSEIHVQYETDEYTHVQDRKAMAMVSLVSVKKNSDWQVGYGQYGDHYELNLNDIGVDITDKANSKEVQKIIKYIKKIFITGGDGRKAEKMYFKLKYDVHSECGDYEYISGYANVMDVDTTSDGNHLYIRLGNPDVDAYNTDGGFSAPCEACMVYFMANKGLDIGQECGDGAVQSISDITSLEDAGEYAEDMALQLIDVLAGENSDIGANVSGLACQQIKTEESYLRIPLPHEKKGGGLRVKRILMYDKGLEDQDASLYGKEYVYQTEKGECSGIATNEPGIAREENALIGYLDKQSYLEVDDNVLTVDEPLIAGENKNQYEGPVGEYVLPSPSVGYSRVVVKNIYSGTTNDGFMVYDFYTAKDYPYDYKESNGLKGVDFTNLSDEKEIYDPKPTFGILQNLTEYACWAAQGFCFVLNNMHGQPKKTTQYEGLYEDINEVNEITPLSSIAYTYFELGDEIPVMYSPELFGEEPLGKEVEVITESKQVSELVNNATVTVDAGIGIFGQYTIPYAFPTYFSTKDESYLCTHVTTKTVYCPAVVKSVTTFQDGVYSTLLNKYFDPKTGDPIVQERSGLYDKQKFDGGDEHEGKYISFNFPASMFYDGMGQKAENEDNANILSAQAGSLLMYGSFDGTDLTSANLTNILAASASVYKNENDLSEEEEDLLKIATYEWTMEKTEKDGGATFIEYLKREETDAITTGQDGKWYVESSYIYKTDVTALGDDNIDHSYEAGTFKDFEFFDWDTPSNNDAEKWLETNTVTLCSHDGKTLEEKNIMDIYSVSKYGYDNTLPYLVGYNCEYEHAFFESFEYAYDNESCGETSGICLEEMYIQNSADRTSNASHSGDYSLKLDISTGTGSAMSIVKSAASVELFNDRDYASFNEKNSYAVKMWVKSEVDFSSLTLYYDGTYTAIPTGTISIPVDFEAIAQTGEWKLYEAKLMADDLASLTMKSNKSWGMKIKFTFNELYTTSNVPSVYVDDIRLQPLDAKLTTYVYDPTTFRLLTQFDDQLFGTYYQYNEEGKLVRISKETERGMKMIKETQYNIPTTNR